MNLSDIQPGQRVKLTPESVFYEAWQCRQFEVERITNGEIYLFDGNGSIDGFYPDEIERV